MRMIIQKNLMFREEKKMVSFIPGFSLIFEEKNSNIYLPFVFLLTLFISFAQFYGIIFLCYLEKKTSSIKHAKLFMVVLNFFAVLYILFFFSPFRNAVLMI